MIKSWTVKNFKSVYDSTTLDFAPLTVFAGANSSGKSTIIQSMLLAVQTIQSPAGQRSVVLNGHITRLGAFRDILSNEADDRMISIGMTVKPNVSSESSSPMSGRFMYYSTEDFFDTVDTVSCLFSFSAGAGDAERDTLQLQPQLEKSEIIFNGSESGEVQRQAVRISRRKESINEVLRANSISEKSPSQYDASPLAYRVIEPLKVQPTGYGQTMLGGDAIGCYLQHFIPRQLIYKYDAVEEQAFRVFSILSEGRGGRYSEITESDIALLQSNKELVKVVIDALETILTGDGPPAYFIRNAQPLFVELKTKFTFQTFNKIRERLNSSLRAKFASVITQQQDEVIAMLKGDRQPDYRLSNSVLPSATAFAAEFLQTFLSSRVKYLGPLRDEPKAIYPLAGAVDHSDVGFKGEHTAAVLEQHKHTPVTYVPSSCFQAELGSITTITCEFQDAVLDWLSYLGIAKNVQTADQGKLGHELRISTSHGKTFHELTHVGVGVSQVLPILVQSLLADEGSTFIFEQPELHLNPKVQTRLADFFVSLTYVGKQSVIETHSEYLITRLRYLSALARGNEISEKVQLYFVEKESSRSIYKPVQINQFGVIADWPRGFFDENEANAAATLKASIEKRRIQKQKNESAQ